MLNEYGTLIRPEIREPFIKLVNELQKKGARIDIIGLQGHFGYYPNKFQIPPISELSLALEELYNETKVPLQITELDLSFHNIPIDSPQFEGCSIDPELPFVSEGINFKSWNEYQVFAYNEVVMTCKSKGYVEAVYFWMFADDSAITWEREGCGLLDEMMELKNGMEQIFS